MTPHMAAPPLTRMTDEELARPPPGVRLERGFGDTLTIVCTPQRKALVVLIPFTVVWSGFALAALYGPQLASGRFDWRLSLFGLPFLLASIGLCSTILYHLFGRTTVTLAKGRVRIFRGVFGWGRTREMVIGPERRVTLARSGIRVNDVPQEEIRLESAGRTFSFGALGLPAETRRYVAAVLQRALGGG
ncbi:MAG: hypothetical protein KBC66_01245 [Kiritimatiellae bacterium]|nr:hypothetical protein [Kiritimatiellia bacterium]NLD89229.1 hypothetical protein [Lentisphaerota bacterium]